VKDRSLTAIASAGADVFDRVCNLTIDWMEAAMCDINAYLMKEGKQELILENVEDVETGPEGEIRLSNIFGEVRTVRARLHSLRNSEKKLVLVSV